MTLFGIARVVAVLLLATVPVHSLPNPTAIATASTTTAQPAFLPLSIDPHRQGLTHRLTIPATTPTPRPCPIAFTPCPAGCCPMTLRPPATLQPELFQPTIEAATWVTFQCPPSGDGACGPRDYYYYVSGRGFTPGGAVSLQFWMYPDPVDGPEGGLVGAYNATGASWGLRAYVLRGEYYSCKLKGYIVAVDEASGRRSNQIEGEISWLIYSTACET